jgi:hypothetical protein
MLVRIIASQRLDPVRPEDGENSETAAKASERYPDSRPDYPGALGARPYFSFEHSAMLSPALSATFTNPSNDGIANSGAPPTKAA